MEDKFLHHFSLTKTKLDDFINKYNLLKSENLKLIEKVDQLTKENVKISTNLKMLEKIIASNSLPKQIKAYNLKDAIDMKQKINKFVDRIDECITILTK